MYLPLVFNSSIADLASGGSGANPAEVTKNIGAVVSWRANRIKCDATPTELMKLAEFYSVLIR
jgi:hypothetical protein